MAAPVLVVVAALAAALAMAGWLAHRLGMPPALGYLAVGIAINPGLAGRLGIPFDIITESSHVAVLVLLFFIGLELDLKRLQQIIRSTAGTTVLNIAIPAVLVAGVASFLGWSLVHGLALGICVSVSSTIFGERLSSLPGFSQDSRRRVLGILLGEDVAAGALLAILVLMGGSSEGGWLAPLTTFGRLLFLLVLMTTAALLLVPRLLDSVARSRVPELLVLVGVVIIVAFGALGSWAGSAELGAFVAGVAAAEAGARFALRGSLSPVRDVCLALFFLGSGMAVDGGLLLDEWLLAVLVAGAFLFSKLAVNVPASLAAGQSPADALRTALGLGTLGEFSLILVAAAQANGVANPALAAVVLGAMVLLLGLAPLLLQSTNVLLRLGSHMPRRLRQAVNLLVMQERKRGPGRQASAEERRNASFLLAANLILLLAWASLAAALGPRVVARFAPDGSLLVPILVFAVALAAAAPLVQRAYRAYRDLVWLLVGLRPGESTLDGAGRVRARLVDAWVAATTVLLLVPVALVVPSTLPVLLGGALVAIAIIALAWRRLSTFQRALESTVTRVLGHDPKSSLLLDQVLARYPWGVRFAAGTVAAESPVAGRTIAESRIPELTGALVAVLERGGKETVNPPAGTRLLAGDSVVLMGTPEELTKAEALLMAHGDALRMSVQSRLAEVVELPVEAGSPLVGRTLAQADLRAQTGALVVGLWHHGAVHPEPFRPDLVVHAEDHLILLGSPLQVERARHFTSNGSLSSTADDE